MPAAQPQAISGVSAGRETVMETVYPSISASGLGRLIGSICDSIPVRIAGVKLSYLLFGLPLAPLALAGYAVFKLFGDRYVISNRTVKIFSAIGETLKGQANIADIDNVAIDVKSGQGFYHAGDLVLLKANGDELLRLPAVVRPERFRHVILEAREARLLSDSTLATIDARQLQTA
ncbi:MAG: hypothetical protein KDA86_25715 [Planctomycetaceae bacterium]|nr:hypothetical protein [Planctomycetaceae bacterium]